MLRLYFTGEPSVYNNITIGSYPLQNAVCESVHNPVAQRLIRRCGNCHRLEAIPIETLVKDSGDYKLCAGRSCTVFPLTIGKDEDLTVFYRIRDQLGNREPYVGGDTNVNKLQTCRITTPR